MRSVRQTVFRLAVLALCLLLPLCAAGCDTGPAVTVTVFAVGKADAILVQADEAVMLIDCGEAADAEDLLAALDARGITRLDLLQITHFDKDHVGGAAAVVEHFGDIGRILYPDYAGDRKEYTAFMAAVADRTEAKAVTAVTEAMLGGAVLTVYPADDPGALIDDGEEYDNELSLVTRMRSGSRTYLFCGDVEGARLKQMLQSDVDWRCDWIKMPHHGQYDKRLDDLLDACRPSAAVMTVSADEPADDKTLALLAERGVSVYDTLAGHVVTRSDGSSLSVAVEP